MYTYDICSYICPYVSPCKYVTHDFYFIHSDAKSKSVLNMTLYYSCTYVRMYTYMYICAYVNMPTVCASKYAFTGSL